MEEERDLPSERAAKGRCDDEAEAPDIPGLLARRRAEARRQIREALGACPDGFTAEEWAVVLAVLSPPEVAPGSHGGRATLTDAARRCFPGFALPAALRAFREVASRAHVREVVADIRAIEVQDVLEQRGYVRGVLRAVADMACNPAASLLDLMLADASGAARIGAAAASAAKALADLDGLKAKDDELANAAPVGADPLDELAARLRRVSIDVAAREVP